MTPEDRILRLENAFATLSEVVAESEARTGTVLELLRNMDERMDAHLSWINQLGEAQANSEAKIAALADAQLRTEEIFRAQAVRTDATLAQLAESQAHTDRRLDALIDIVSKGRNGNSQE